MTALLVRTIKLRLWQLGVVLALYVAIGFVGGLIVMASAIDVLRVAG
jgi:hypothetical protein